MTETEQRYACYMLQCEDVELPFIMAAKTKGERRTVRPKQIESEVKHMDYEQDYITMLKQDLADENETVRKYLATLAVAPNGAVGRLLEIMADELDHIAVVSDLLLEAAAGQSADQEALVPGVE